MPPFEEMPAGAIIASTSPIAHEGRIVMPCVEVEVRAPNEEYKRAARSRGEKRNARAGGTMSNG
jgi:hypothetical protein